ncbi:hypothetical protein Csa_004144 [Cucumis sativus]|uniref:Uncharacterized protein n=1 Tax=Cucumis sativus TaxID=3659 RepID=A0A0A0KK79_CUCSA|nr:hypothetical protein Csa_004144 [Cucumis sativus]
MEAIAYKAWVTRTTRLSLLSGFRDIIKKNRHYGENTIEKQLRPWDSNWEELKLGNGKMPLVNSKAIPINHETFVKIRLRSLFEQSTNAIYQKPK